MHNGHMYFTVGQRKGLGIGARNSAYDKPWYVAVSYTHLTLPTNREV